MQATEFAQMDVDLETAIGWHLRGNHYPPVPLSMLQPCIEAIEAFNEDRDTGRLIAMPEGVSYKGMSEAPAWAIIEQHHLEPWLELDMDEAFSDDY